MKKGLPAHQRIVRVQSELGILMIRDSWGTLLIQHSSSYKYAGVRRFTIEGPVSSYWYKILCTPRVICEDDEVRKCWWNTGEGFRRQIARQILMPGNVAVDICIVAR